MATLKEKAENDQKQQQTNVSEQHLGDDPQGKTIHHQEMKNSSEDQKETDPEVSGGVNITPSVEEKEKADSKSDSPPLAEKLKGKIEHAEAKLKGKEDGLEEDPNPELSYVKAAETPPKASFFSKMKETIWMGGKHTDAAPTQKSDTDSKEEEDLSKELGEKLDLKSSSESATSEGIAAADNQNQAPGFLQRMAHKIGLSSTKTQNVSDQKQ